MAQPAEHTPGPEYGRPVGDESLVVSMAEHRMAYFMRVLELALADEAAMAPLSQAGIVARIELTDLEGASVVLAFDRTPVKALRGPGDLRPDVWLRMSSADLEAVLYRGEHLPLRILSGDVTFQGPVRKLLRVLPMLTRAATDADAQLASNGRRG